MTNLSVIELAKEEMGFSAGHFTVFSATHREKLHGHNYQVACYLTTRVSDLGLMFDYREYKNNILELCSQLHQTFLLPGRCPHLKIIEEPKTLVAKFNGENIPFLKSDVVILPLKNITVEELSRWFLEDLCKNERELEQHGIEKIEIRVSNAPGVSGSASWTATLPDSSNSSDLI